MRMSEKTVLVTFAHISLIHNTDCAALWYIQFIHNVLDAMVVALKAQNAYKTEQT